MEADTVLAIDKLMIANTGVDAVSDTQLDLRQGTSSATSKETFPRPILIKTPNGNRRRPRHDVS